MIGKYILYKLFAKHKYGHGIHSPFVFNLITGIFNKKNTQQPEIEIIRKKLLQDNTRISINDLGAGSRKLRSDRRKISDIAVTSLKPEKYAKLIYEFTAHFKPKIIIEFGTSLGITTAYIAKASPKSIIHTFEGCPNISKIAKETFDRLALNNIKQHTSSFDNALNLIKEEKIKPDMVFIDGNHTYDATLKYFEFFLDHSHENSILLFDDIYWTKEMYNAWNKIKEHPSSIVTIDLFSLGIVFMDNSLTPKHYVIKF